MNDLLRRRLQISALLADIEAAERELKFLSPREAAEALEIVRRIERRLAANFMDTRPKDARKAE